jgi:hypothetical protein
LEEVCHAKEDEWCVLENVRKDHDGLSWNISLSQFYYL